MAWFIEFAAPRLSLKADAWLSLKLSADYEVECY